jgi:choline dehydrogenase-like flavoprotein
MVHVQSAAEPHLFSFALLEGAESVGLQCFPNPNGRMMEAAGGCAFVDETVRDGKRQSIFRSYVYPLIDRPNITVLTGALAARILFHRRRATGVEFHYQGKTHRTEATGDVILSLGAIHTPKVLMQSGIGDEAELRRVDIPVLEALPGWTQSSRSRCIWLRLGKYRQGAAQRAEKPDRLLLEDNRCVGGAKLLLVRGTRGPCQPRECSSIQTSRCLLDNVGRHAAQESGCRPCNGFGSSRTGEDRRAIPPGSTGPEGPNRRSKDCSRDW